MNLNFVSRLKAYLAGTGPKRTRASDSVPDLEIAEPLVGILPDADPQPDLLERIEASLDQAAMTHVPEPDKPAAAGSFRGFLSGALCGGILVAALAFFALDQQKIVARTASANPWLPLGSVTLWGSDLRSFVKAKCQGQTHLFITLHGQNAENNGENASDGVPVMSDGEKILMECIYSAAAPVVQ